MKEYQQFPGHTWTLLANNTTQWFGSDSELKFNAHKKDTAQNKLLEKFGWLETELQYRFNSQGFRCDEFDNRPCAVANPTVSVLRLSHYTNTAGDCLSNEQEASIGYLWLAIPMRVSC